MTDRAITIDIADTMNWLPSSRDALDPIYGNKLECRAEELGAKSEIPKAVLAVYKLALEGVRGFKGDALLQAGPHDFTESAKGAAVFAARRAAYEVLVGRQGFWCAAIRLYEEGHWLCGLLPDGQVIVL